MSTATPAKASGDLIESDDTKQHAMVAIGESRAAQEVQAAMVVAKNFPRDYSAAYQRIIKSCKRRTLAEQSMYSYPRGGTTITGPSIRLAEVLAQNWGNIDFGIVEVEQKYGSSTMLAYAWDLETNTRVTKTFTVRHVRYTRKGSYDLTDPRDIYELTANQEARRLRACILGVIPGDICDAAVKECERTLTGSNEESRQDRMQAMMAAFSELAVTQDQIVTRLGHNLDSVTEIELVNLRKIYMSIRDNASAIEQWFPPEQPKTAPETASDALADRLEPTSETPSEATPSEATPEQPEAGDKATSDEVMTQFVDAIASVKTLVALNAVENKAKDHLNPKDIEYLKANWIDPMRVQLRAQEDEK